MDKDKARAAVEWLDNGTRIINEYAGTHNFPDADKSVLEIHNTLRDSIRFIIEGGDETSVVVPREPTKEMLERGCDAWCAESMRNDSHGVKDSTYIPVWNAMIAAHEKEKA